MALKFIKKLFGFEIDEITAKAYQPTASELRALVTLGIIPGIIPNPVNTETFTASARQINQGATKLLEVPPGKLAYICQSWGTAREWQTADEYCGIYATDSIGNIMFWLIGFEFSNPGHYALSNSYLRAIKLLTGGKVYIEVQGNRTTMWGGIRYWLENI